MKATHVKEIFRNPEAFDGKEIVVSGWIRTLRASKNFGFIELNDGTFFNNIQVVFEENLSNFAEVSKYSIATSIIVTGKLEITPDAKQPFEIKATEIVLEGASDPSYPLQKKRHTFEYLRTIAHLRPRSNTFSAVFRVRSVLAYAIHKFYQEKGYVYAHTPIITGSDCEGAGEMFRVTTMDLNNVPKTEDGAIDETKDFFGKETNLTVSGQLAGETFCMAFRNIYTFGPTFRSENSNTARHAAEFWMVEPEIAFADLNDNMDLAEEMVRYIVKYVMDECPEEIDFFNQRIDKGLKDRLNHLLSSDFERLTYTRAVELLKEAKVDFEYPVEWGIDLQTEHERYLTEKVFNKPVFVTDYPKDIKAFYMRMNDDNKTVAAMDLLVPGVGELIGGSQREERLDVLENRINEMGMNTDDYWWYLELRKFGGTKHAGFGLGFERMIMYMTGMANIRDVIPFPRTVNNAEF
jgi:asparaginyl-tRNA synthetase